MATTRTFLAESVMESGIPRPGVVKVIRNLAGPLEDGSVVKEVADSAVFMTAFFSKDCMLAFQQSFDDSFNTPPDWNEALLLLNKYCVKLQPAHAPNNDSGKSRFVLMVERFGLYNLHEGFHNKHLPQNIMADKNVEAKVAELESHQGKGVVMSCDNSGEVSLSLSVLLDGMGESSLQPSVSTDLPHVSKDDPIKPPEPASSDGSIKSALKKMLCLRVEDFVISSKQQALLDAIPEWQEGYIPPATDSVTETEPSAPSGDSFQVALQGPTLRPEAEGALSAAYNHVPRGCDKALHSAAVTSPHPEHACVRKSGESAPSVAQDLPLMSEVEVTNQPRSVASKDQGNHSAVGQAGGERASGQADISLHDGAAEAQGAEGSKSATSQDSHFHPDISFTMSSPSCCEDSVEERAVPAHTDPAMVGEGPAPLLSNTDPPTGEEDSSAVTQLKSPQPQRCNVASPVSCENAEDSTAAGSSSDGTAQGGVVKMTLQDRGEGGSAPHSPSPGGNEFSNSMEYFDTQGFSPTDMSEREGIPDESCSLGDSTDISAPIHCPQAAVRRQDQGLEQLPADSTEMSKEVNSGNIVLRGGQLQTDSNVSTAGIPRDQTQSEGSRSPHKLANSKKTSSSPASREISDKIASQPSRSSRNLKTKTTESKEIKKVINIRSKSREQSNSPKHLSSDVSNSSMEQRVYFSTQMPSSDSHSPPLFNLSPVLCPSDQQEGGHDSSGLQTDEEEHGRLAGSCNSEVVQDGGCHAVPVPDKQCGSPTPAVPEHISASTSADGQTDSKPRVLVDYSGSEDVEDSLDDELLQQACGQTVNTAHKFQLESSSQIVVIPDSGQDNVIIISSSDDSRKEEPHVQRLAMSNKSPSESEKEKKILPPRSRASPSKKVEPSTCLNIIVDHAEMGQSKRDGTDISGTSEQREDSTTQSKFQKRKSNWNSSNVRAKRKCNGSDSSTSPQASRSGQHRQQHGQGTSLTCHRAPAAQATEPGSDSGSDMEVSMPVGSLSVRGKSGPVTKAASPLKQHSAQVSVGVRSARVKRKTTPTEMASLGRHCLKQKRTSDVNLDCEDLDSSDETSLRIPHQHKCRNGQECSCQDSVSTSTMTGHAADNVPYSAEPAQRGDSGLTRKGNSVGRSKQTKACKPAESHASAVTAKEGWLSASPLKPRVGQELDRRKTTTARNMGHTLLQSAGKRTDTEAECEDGIDRDQGAVPCTTTRGQHRQKLSDARRLSSTSPCAQDQLESHQRNILSLRVSSSRKSRDSVTSTLRASSTEQLCSRPDRPTSSGDNTHVVSLMQSRNSQTRSGVACASSHSMSRPAEDMEDSDVHRDQPASNQAVQTFNERVTSWLDALRVQRGMSEDPRQHRMQRLKLAEDVLKKVEEFLRRPCT